MALSVAKKAASRAKFWINKAGQSVTVRRRIGEGADPYVTVTLKCMAQPLDEAKFVPIRDEEGSNVLSARPTNFIFTGDAHVQKHDNGVREGDEILLDEHWWKIGNVRAERIGDVVIIRECVGSRQ